MSISCCHFATQNGSSVIRILAIAGSLSITPATSSDLPVPRTTRVPVSPASALTAASRASWVMSVIRRPSLPAVSAEPGSELVIERVGMAPVRPDDDLAFSPNPGQFAGPGGLDDLPGHPRDTVIPAGVVLQHEAALPPLHSALETLDPRVGGRILGVDRDDVGLAGAGQVSLESLGDVSPRELYAVLVVVGSFVVEAVQAESSLCPLHDS